MFWVSRLGGWWATAPEVSIPWRFDSPRLASTAAAEILLFARYAPNRYQLAPSWLSFGNQKLINLVLCSLLPKSAAAFGLGTPEGQKMGVLLVGHIFWWRGV